MTKKIIESVDHDKDGDTEFVKFKGNTRRTSNKKAIEMAERDEIEGVHVSKTKDGKKYLRSNPDGKKKNNLDNL